MAMEPFDSTKPVFESALTSSEILNNFLALFNGDLGPLRPRASDPLAMSVYVNPSLIEDYWLQVWQGIITPLNFAGDDSPALSAPAANPRIDLLTIDSTGTLEWTEGEEAADPDPPNCPEDKIPLCYVYCKTTMTKIVNFEDQATYPTDGYIYQDIRPLINLGGSPAAPCTNFQSYMKEFAGDASDGDVTISSNTTLADSGVGVKVMKYDELTVDAGFYLQPHANDKILVILAKTINLEGTIKADERGGAGSTVNNYGGVAGGGAGGGGGGSYADLKAGSGGGGGGQDGEGGWDDTTKVGGGQNVTDYLWSPTLPVPLYGKGGNGTIGAVGAVGSRLLSSPILSSLPFEIVRYLYGGGGGSGGSTISGASGKNGGNGGGVIWIEAETINWGAAGLVSCNGGNGENGDASERGGGGGGAGGFVLIAYKNKTGSSTIQVNAGAGGTGYTASFAGGNGAAGSYIELQTE